MSQFQVGEEDLKPDQVPDEVGIMLLSVKHVLFYINFKKIPNYIYIQYHNLFQSLLPGVVLTVKGKEQVHHVPIALMTERQVVRLHREEEHENEPPMVHDCQPEQHCLAKMTIADLVLLLWVMPDDVEGEVILKSKAEILSVTRLDEVEQSLRCKLDILLLNEALQQQPFSASQVVLRQKRALEYAFPLRTLFRQPLVTS